MQAEQIRLSYFSERSAVLRFDVVLDSACDIGACLLPVHSSPHHDDEKTCSFCLHTSLKLHRDLQALRFGIRRLLSSRLAGRPAILHADLKREVLADGFNRFLASLRIFELGKSGAYTAGRAVHGEPPNPGRIGGTLEANHQGSFGDRL